MGNITKFMTVVIFIAVMWLMWFIFVGGYDVV